MIGPVERPCLAEAPGNLRLPRHGAQACRGRAGSRGRCTPPHHRRPACAGDRFPSRRRRTRRLPRTCRRSARSGCPCRARRRAGRCRAAGRRARPGRSSSLRPIRPPGASSTPCLLSLEGGQERTCTGRRLMPLKKFERRRVGAPASSIRSEVRNHLLEPDLHLELREVRPEAEMRPAEAEREMPVRLPPEVEPVRVGELLLVVVASGVPHRHLIAGPDPAAVDRHFACRGPPEVVDGMGAAKELVGRAAGERRICDEAGLLLGMGEQIEQGEADRVPRRLVPGSREEDEEQPELVLGEARAVDLGLDEPRRDVVQWLGAPGLRRACSRSRSTPARMGSRTAACAARGRGAHAPRRTPPPRSRDPCCRGSCLRAR